MRNRTIKKSVAMAAALALVVGCIPVGQVHAEDVEIGGTTVNREVTGNFTVSDSDLADMGYGPMISVPLSISLSYQSSESKYSGSGTIYGYGILDNGKSITASINTSSSKYGKVYDKDDEDCTIASGSGFSCTLSKERWSKAECRANMEAKKTGASVPHTGSLTVAVSKNSFLPTGTGNYKTYVPLVIQLAGD